MQQVQEIKFSDLAGFQPKQLEAAKALREFKYLLYGGAAGGGKSYFLRWIAIRLLIYYAQTYNVTGVRVGLFCEDYPSLNDRHLSKIPFEFPTYLGRLNKSSHEFVLDPRYGSGVIAFRNLDDPSKYLSSEFASILIDELTKNKREMFDFLNMRMRWPGIKDVKFIGATNPGEVGHGWVKKLWITRDFKDENYDAEEFAFVQAKYDDNSYLDESYEKQLGSLPENLRRAYMEGDWDIFAGQYFPEFRREYHVCKPFEIPKEWPRFICGDYGYTAPSAVYWMAYDEQFDDYVCYREIYERGLTHKDLALKIREANREDNIPARDVIFDPAIWAKKDSPRSGADEMMSVFRPDQMRLHKGDNSRVVGWNRVHEVLKTYEIDKVTKGHLRIFSTSKELIRTLPELVHDDHKVEDVDCFVAGTKVNTLSGVKNIEDIKVNEYVLTPIGYKKVLNSGLSGYVKTIKQIFNNGSCLEGTFNHKIIVDKVGLKHLSDLNSYDTLMVKNKTLLWSKQLLTGGLNIEDIKIGDIMSLMELIYHRVILHYIVRSGLIVMEKFRKIIMYIIRIMIMIIMKLKILSWFKKTFMQDCIIKKEKKNLLNVVPNGEGVKAEKINSKGMRKKCAVKYLKENLRVKIVKKLLQLNIRDKNIVRNVCGEKVCMKKSALYAVIYFFKRKMGIKQHKHVHINVVGNCVSRERKAVYNLTIEDAHLYYANGFLVSNSDGDDHGPDAVRYGLLWHKNKAIQTKSETYEIGPGTRHIKMSDFEEAFDDDDDEGKVDSLFTF